MWGCRAIDRHGRYASANCRHHACVNPHGTARRSSGLFQSRLVGFLGCSLDDVCGWRWTNVIHPDDVAGIVQKWHAALASGEPFEAEARVRRADGEYRMFLHRKVPMHDEEGRIVKWFGSSIDIDDRKRAEEASRQREKDLQELIDAVPQHILVAAPDGRPLFVNKAALEYYGVTHEELVWLSVETKSSVQPDDKEWVGPAYWNGIASGKLFTIELRRRRADGEYRWFLFRANPHRDGNGRIDRWYITQTDIEDLKRAETALRRREAYLAQAQALSHTGSFGWNLATGELHWSDETFDILGYKKSVKPSLDLVFDRVHPDDLALVREALSRASEDQDGFDFEHKLLLPNGAIKHVHVIARPFKDERGNVELIGSVMDVTAHQKAFQEIHALKDELYKENIVLREEIGKTSMFEEVVGTSSVLQMVLARAAKVAPTDSTVLITGETGTGKELVARAIHKRSKRADRPFISVNCAAIPSSLIMPELFGHEKGAFTGAIQRRLGRFELAEGGTLFLDEIGDLPAETQIALLRVLQEHEFERVGGTEILHTDVRVIAATNRDLQAAVAVGSLRSDLYYRLNVFPIKLPPLRERREDIPLLVNYFIDRLGKRAGKKIKNIRKKAMKALQDYSWPGNVRELQNVIERSLIVSETDEFSIDKSWVANQPRSPASRAPSVPSSGERERIEATLAQSKGRVAGESGAAAILGVPASTLESRIRALRIDKAKFKFASI
ncbi:MAG: sigma 54-interacting transcriptional regulator [Chthoniobacterales bacterium]